MQKSTDTPVTAEGTMLSSTKALSDMDIKETVAVATAASTVEADLAGFVADVEQPSSTDAN
eukprot:4011651-Prymnesium_polylepis.1